MADDFNFGLPTIDGASGSEMLREFQDKRLGREQEDREEKEAPAFDYKKDIDELQAKLAERDRSIAELRGATSTLERQHSTMEQYLRSQTQSRPVQQQSNELPELPQFEDEQVQKVVNAIEARNEKRFERLSQQQQQQHNQYAFNQEIRMINAALKDVRSERPDFAKVVSDQHISDFAKPFLADARYFGNVDWHKEFRLMAQTAEHPLLETENAQLKARIAQLEGSKDRQRKEQKDSLSKAPTFGQRAGKSEDSMGGTHAGDRVLNRWNKSNKARGKSKSPMPWNNFGAELIREMERSSQ